ncbi:MAG: DNA repair protein RecN [Chlorobi bacterium]|nr:DNA repair protein RecN [Chlorobiota bacterium]
MLKTLSISNYILIDKIELSLNDGFTVITGETGAGKSIILGALSLILGNRSDVSVLLDKERKCIVEGEFMINGYGLESMFEENDVDYEEHTIIRREVLPTGKSRAFINDTPVNLSFLKQVTSKLVDIHSQHQNLFLGDKGFQLMVVDTVHGDLKVKEEYSALFKEYTGLSEKIDSLVEENEKQKADYDYIQFQYRQLEEANLTENELSGLEDELQQMTHAEDIKMSLVGVHELLNGEHQPALAAIKEAKGILDKVSDFFPEAGEMMARLETAYIDISDLAGEVIRKAETVEYDPQAISEKQERVDLLNSLMHKHRVNDVNELIKLRDEYDEKLRRFDSFDEEIEQLREQKKKLEKKLKKSAEVLTRLRRSVFDIITRTILKQLAELGMEHARFEIRHKLLEVPTPKGQDEIVFLFSANKNTDLAPIDKVASGGEMSRLMLSIKALLSTSKGLPTIIFDEIDSGVSGEVADKMGRILGEMAETIQVIAITHLPQIAVKGKQHFKVYKTDDDTRTSSGITELNGDDRVVEIAKMLSGADLSDAALNNARALLEN